MIFLKSLQNLLSSIKASERRVSEGNVIKVDLKHKSALPMTKEVLKIQSSSLQKLFLHKCLMTDSALVEILRIVPEIQTLSLTESRITKRGSANMNFKMPNLKKVDFTETSYTSDYKKPFDVYSTFFRDFAEMISASPFLEEVAAGFNFLQFFSFEKFKLKKLTMIGIDPKDLRIGEIIEMQPKLESLALRKCFVMDEATNRLRNCKNLKSLSICTGGMTTKGFMMLSCLGLQELKVEAFKSLWITDAFTIWHFANLTSLSLNFERLAVTKITFKCLFNMMKKVDSLHIKTSCTSILNHIFETRLRDTLKKVTIEYVNLELLDNIEISQDYPESLVLQDFHVVNTNAEFAQKADFNLQKFPNLRRIHLEGFIVTRQGHLDAMRIHFDLEYLELRERKSSIASYEFDNTLAFVLLKFGGKLQVVKIDCLSFSLSRAYTKQFPVIQRKGVLITLRHR